REDLYFRLDVVHVHLPPLRDRREEVRPLAAHFLRLSAERAGRADVIGFAPGVLELLEADDWPGNVRALENTIERAVLLSAGTEISVDDLPARFLSRAAAAAPPLPKSPRAPSRSDGRLTLPPSAGDGMIDLRAAVDALESRLIRDALERSKNNKQRAADLLGIKRTTLIDMMKRKGLAA
ncbi:MAG: sigma-54-dependent Fis family transcriptional regulator, partial [Labilithrix sp.]|nr:sigma-54-dependent Fis family transcriptional regulator [Labilithrix sp.]